MYENLRLAIIGSGKWGKNHVKTASKILDPKNITVCDLDPETENLVSQIDGDIKFTSDFNCVLEDEGINAFIIATPADTHFKLAKSALEKGKNVLVEKPITLYSSEAETLVEIAKKNSVKLMVGHILLFHSAIKTIKGAIDLGKIGNLQYIYSNRLNLGTLRQQENILWSFAPHDISIIQYFTGNYPTEVYCHGADFLQNNIEDTTLTYLRYPGNIHAHIYVSWLHPFKEQRLVVVGSKGMYAFEDTAKDDKLKFYSKGFKSVNGSFEKIDGDAEIVALENTNPLHEEQIHFFNSILNDTDPLTNGIHALEVLRILESAQKGLESAKLGKNVAFKPVPVN